MRMKTRIDDEEEISISSIASMDEDRKAKVNNAMMMVFYCSRKSFEQMSDDEEEREKEEKRKKEEMGRKKYKFSSHIVEGGNVMKKKYIVQACQDISEIISINKDILYYHINEFVRLQERARDFAALIKQGAMKKGHSF